MTKSSGIAWTEKTWNPIVGCEKIAIGCKNCYAERQAKRLKAMGQAPYQTVVDENGWTGKIALNTDRKFNEPLRTRKPTTFFVNSMSDLFHKDVPWNDLFKIFQIMVEADQHIYQIATKRPDNARRELSPVGNLALHLKRQDWFHGKTWPLPNVQIIFSASTQPDLERGIEAHFATPAAVRGLSLEPLLGEIDLHLYIGGDDEEVQEDLGQSGETHCLRCGCAWEHGHECPPGFGPRIGWIIVGCESGPKRRLSTPVEESHFWAKKQQIETWMSWLRSIIKQCAAAGVRVFVKQVPIADNSKIGWRVSRDPSDWPEWTRVQQYPKGAE